MIQAGASLGASSAAPAIPIEILDRIHTARGRRGPDHARRGHGGRPAALVRAGRVAGGLDHPAAGDAAGGDGRQQDAPERVARACSFLGAIQRARKEPVRLSVRSAGDVPPTISLRRLICTIVVPPLGAYCYTDQRWIKKSVKEFAHG